MQELAVAGQRLEGVAERVAVVEHSAQTGFLAFVLFDHIGLQAAAAADNMCQGIGAPLDQAAGMLFQPGEEFGVENHAVLDHFGQPGAVLPHGKGLQHRRIDQHAARLPETADHVLGGGQVDTDFAAHRTIDLGQERRGNLKERQAAREGGGHKARQIADHSAADSDNRRLAVGSEVEELSPQLLGDVDRFHRLARFDHQEIDA
jgi:hypothetical protein